MPALALMANVTGSISARAIEKVRPGIAPNTSPTIVPSATPKIASQPSAMCAAC